MSQHYILQDVSYKQGELDTEVAVEESIIWDEEIEGQQTLNYLESSQTVLTDTISESYCTADEDENATQYFSVLGTPNTTALSDLSVTITANEQEQEETVGEQQVVLCNIDGELYGFQIGEDEEGNLQKYQFKVRQNEQGQLEAVPETIEVLSMENEEIEGAAQESEENASADSNLNNTLTQQDQLSTKITVKREFPQGDISSDMPQESPVNDDESDSEEEAVSSAENTVEEAIDSKMGILEKRYIANPKQEIMDENSCGSELVETEEFEENVVEEPVQDDIEHYEQVFVEETHVTEVKSTEQLPLLNEDDTSQDTVQSEESNCLIPVETESENDDYQIVEGVHVTGDTEDSLPEEESPEEISLEMFGKSFPHQEIEEPVKTKTAIRSIALKDVRCNFDNEANKNANYLLIKHPEKENVIQRTNVSLYESNPRSILKSSFPKFRQTKEQVYEDRWCAKNNKESTQARMFNKYIAATSIIHAPVRHHRLPRKQTIKPVERTDEEIIVQEVVVSSNGFIETSEDGVLKSKEPLKPTEFLDLTDSDDDYDPKKGHKRKRKKSRRSKIEIVISDSDENESEQSVIHIESSDNSNEPSRNNLGDSLQKRGRGRPKRTESKANTPNVTPSKRGRGRPPKQQQKSSSGDESYDELNNIRKELEKQLKVNDGVTEIAKNEIKCMKCTKTFPSQGSLQTHMQYHNFKESSKMNLRQTAQQSKYKCTECNEILKNNALLTRHMADHRTLGCNICKKILPDQLKLTAHKRSHVKERMVRSTTFSKISPKKLHAPSLNASKLVKTIGQQEKCGVCGRVFYSAVDLENHSKTHRKYNCISCSTSFVSKLMLDNHLRESCVKSPAHKRLSLKPRKSFARPLPVSRSKTLQKEKTLMDESSASKSNATFVSVKCEKCSETFSTYTNLLKHKVVKHGLDTPDKSILQNKKRPLYKQREVHGGIPANNRLRSAYANLRSKLAKD